MKYPDLYKVRNPEMREQLEEAFRNYMGDKPITGDIYFVDDSGSANGSGTFDSPITTLDLANDLCTAGNNDVIFLKPGHAENLASSTACVLNLKGVTVIGLGNGEERPKLTAITAADAGIVVSGASVSIFNVILICNKDGATSLLKITGTGFTGDIEIRDTSNTVEAAVGVLTEATADYLNLKLKYQGFTDGSGTTTAVRLVGADYARLSVDFYGKAGTSVVEAHTTAVKNLVMYNMHVYNQGDTTYAKAFVDTVGGSTWSYKGFCGENGVNVSGSQDTAISATDTSGITAALAVVDAFHDVPTADTADNVVMSDVIGNKTDTTAGTSIVALLKQIYAREGAPAGASMSADIAAIKTIVDALNTASITEIADILAAVDTEVADILTDTGTTLPALFAVKVADSADNSDTRDVVGNKTDTVSGTSLVALAKQILANEGTPVGADLSADIAAIQADLGNPSARTNLQTIQAMLGNPDTAAQSVWDCLTGAGGIATFPAGAAAANDVSLAEVLRYVQENIIVGTGTALPANQSIYDMFAGANGIAAFPAAANPANGISLAAVVRDAWDNVGDAKARTNLQSLVAMLGNPDTANQSIWDCLTGAGGIATFPAGAAAANDVSIAEVLRYIQENIIVGTGTALPNNQSLYDILAGTNGIATFPASAAPANDVSLAEVIRDIWDVLRNGTGGTEPSTNTSIIDEIRKGTIDINHTNYISVTADMTSGTWNTQATHEVFTVTGNVRMIMWNECTGTLTDTGDAGTIQFGVAGTTNAFIASSDTDNVTGGSIWADNTPGDTYGNYSSLVLDKVVSNGIDVGYEIGGEALTGGALVFHCVWFPLNATGNVAAGAGGAL